MELHIAEESGIKLVDDSPPKHWILETSHFVKQSLRAQTPSLILSDSSSDFYI